MRSLMDLPTRNILRAFDRAEAKSARSTDTSNTDLIWAGVIMGALGLACWAAAAANAFDRVRR